MYFPEETKDKTAAATLFALRRWQGNVVCPKCGNTDIKMYRLPKSENGMSWTYNCKFGHMFSAINGSRLHGTMSLALIFRTAYALITWCGDTPPTYPWLAKVTGSYGSPTWSRVAGLKEILGKHVWQGYCRPLKPGSAVAYREFLKVVDVLAGHKPKGKLRIRFPRCAVRSQDNVPRLNR